MFPTEGWKPNKPHNVKSVATSNIAVLENEEVNNTEKKSRFGESATLELSDNYFREKSPNSAAMLMESKAAARTLKVGSRGEDVKRLQENLNTLGYNTGKPDGIFGNGTKNAVIAFQRAKGLTADGIVGSGTQNAITRALNEKTAAANSNILKVGSKGAKVTQLQRNLNSLGYNAGTPDGAFGTGTKNAVVSFQKTYGLSADGVAGKATQDAIATTISRKSKGILSKGQVSNDVRNLQNDLKTLGYLASNADGAFGTGTEAAVKAFQKNHNLTQDGLVGASTRSHISAAVERKKQKQATSTTNPSQPKNSEPENHSKESERLEMSDKGFSLLMQYEVGQNANGVDYDKNGNITAIAIKDIGDGKYTVGFGNTVDKNDSTQITEYREKYGLDVTKIGTKVDIGTCKKIYNDHVNYYTSKVDDLLKRTNYHAKQNEYEALVLAVYNRPALANKGKALENLLKNNVKDKKEWEKQIMDDYHNGVSTQKWNIYNKGWRNRTLDEIELFFESDYKRNH